MASRKCVLSIYAYVLTHAARVEELEVGVDGVDSADGAHVLTSFTSLREPVSHVNSAPAVVHEQVSPQEMQQELLEFLSNQKPTWPDVPGHPGRRFKKILNEARAKNRSRDKVSCPQQLGGLMMAFGNACQDAKGNDKVMRTRCSDSVNRLFLSGDDIVQVLEVGRDLAHNQRHGAKPFHDTGTFLKEWMVPLATARKSSILWAGFWTNVSDPEGNQSRTSKENLLKFADLIETQVVHPSTRLGRMVDNNGKLEACQGPKENFLKRNMWSFASFSFIYGMRKKKQDVVVALVHKELDGPWPINESILFQYEVPTISIAAWGLGFWSPLVVLIDLLGTCNQTSPLLRKQLYSGLTLYRSWGVQRAEDFVWRSRLSWTCLDCPHSNCHLDQDLADQVKRMIQAKKRQDRLGKALIKALHPKHGNGDLNKAMKLLKQGADVNFQDNAGNTPLSVACKVRDLADSTRMIVQTLLKHGAFVVNAQTAQILRERGLAHD